MALRLQLGLLADLVADAWWRDVTLPMLESMRRRVRGLDVGELYEPPFTSVSPGGPERLFSDSAVDSIEEVLKGIKATAVPVEPAAG